MTVKSWALRRHEMRAGSGFELWSREKRKNVFSLFLSPHSPQITIILRRAITYIYKALIMYKALL